MNVVLHVLRVICGCRSYKSGYVWHDLCDDDLILPAHGNEYVLKGSELFEESNSGDNYLLLCSIYSAISVLNKVLNEFQRAALFN